MLYAIILYYRWHTCAPINDPLPLILCCFDSSYYNIIQTSGQDFIYYWGKPEQAPNKRYSHTCNICIQVWYNCYTKYIHSMALQKIVHNIPLHTFMSQATLIQQIENLHSCNHQRLIDSMHAGTQTTLQRNTIATIERHLLTSGGEASMSGRCRETQHCCKLHNKLHNKQLHPKIKEFPYE